MPRGAFIGSKNSEDKTVVGHFFVFIFLCFISGLKVRCLNTRAKRNKSVHIFAKIMNTN